MDLWEKIKGKIKELKPKQYELWLEPIKYKQLDDNILTLTVPNKIFLTKFEEIYTDDIKQYANKLFGQKLEIKLVIEQIEPESNSSYRPLKHPKKKTFQEKRREKTTFDSTTNFRSQEELNTFIQDSKKHSEKKEIEEQSESHQLKQLELISMPGKYGIAKVVNFATFDSRFFTYPSDKRQSSKVSIKIKFENGSYKEYDLYRGLFYKGDKGSGQLNTTHAKILLAIIHLWQQQGSRFADKNGYFAIVNVSIRELAEILGYKQFGGKNFKDLFDKVIELTKIPSLLVSGEETFSMQFLSNLGVSSSTTEKQKTVINLQINPFISKQLYERKAFLRNPDIYRIKNPTAFKFLVCYDKKIFKGNTLKLDVREVAKDLQLEARMDSIIRTLKTAIQELNNYELHEDYLLKVELIKEDRKYFVIAQRVSKRPKQNTVKNNQENLQAELTF